VASFKVVKKRRVKSEALWSKVTETNLILSKLLEQTYFPSL